MKVRFPLSECKQLAPGIFSPLSVCFLPRLVGVINSAIDTCAAVWFAIPAPVALLPSLPATVVAGAYLCVRA